MNKLIIFIAVFLLYTTNFAQRTYKVTKDGSGNFKSISEVNSANLKSGDIVSFKSGQQFSDAVLKCKRGVTYNTYGGTIKAIIGDPNKNLNPTIIIDNKNVTITNLKIYGYKNADNVITYSKNNISITDCEILGGANAHAKPTMGIRQTVADAGTGHKFIRNNIHDLGWGIYISRPYNSEIGYNKMYNFWRENGTMDHGGYAIGGDNVSGLSDTWDSKYTFTIHHNDIYNFEYTAFAVGASRIIYEYNNIHDNLDERLFRGGVKHGSVGKLFDNTYVSTGCVGIIFRYNYVHDLIRRGQANYTYGVPSASDIINGTPRIVSTNNGTGQAVYLNAVSNNENGFGKDFGDRPQESPDNVISGLGYANIWIHNNIFENCSNRIFTRTAISGDKYGSTAYRKDLGSYFINNTIINCGYLDYITKDSGILQTDWNMFSDHTIVNNIIDFTNPNALAAIHIKGDEQASKGKLYIDDNIYTKQGGVTTSNPKYGDKVAVWFSGTKRNKLSGNGEQYFTNPDWNNINDNFFASNIGPNGTEIPDVRLKSGGNANNRGKNFNLLGDTYPDPLGVHSLGKDPTGRSFAYDILGNLRPTNDIGALGTVDIDISTQGDTPTITVQPSNVSANEGSNISFSVSATCKGQIGYQWWKFPFVSESESKISNNSKYSGATSNTLTIKKIDQSDNNTKYICEVYNTANPTNLRVNSDVVTLEVFKAGGGSSSISNLKVFLEGPFQKNNMSTFLLENNFIPKAQPYNFNPFNYTGSEKVTDFPNNIVDWILVELRSDRNTRVKRFAALLRNDGIVVNTSGKQDFTDYNIKDGDYYLVIHHRNHLSIMSAFKIPVKNSVLNYDFTTNLAKAYGSEPMVLLNNGSYAMYAGNGDANNIVSNLDFGSVANNIFRSGYYSGDLDMNGIINVLDYSSINKNILKEAQVPK